MFVVSVRKNLVTSNWCMPYKDLRLKSHATYFDWSLRVRSNDTTKCTNTTEGCAVKDGDFTIDKMDYQHREKDQSKDDTNK